MSGITQQTGTIREIEREALVGGQSFSVNRCHRRILFERQTNSLRPEGAAHPVSPLQGLAVGSSFRTQGVALGFRVVPLWGGK